MENFCDFYALDIWPCSVYTFDSPCVFYPGYLYRISYSILYFLSRSFFRSFPNDNGIEQRMPYLGAAPGLLTTSYYSNINWWGTIVSISIIPGVGRESTVSKVYQGPCRCNRLFQSLPHTFMHVSQYIGYQLQAEQNCMYRIAWVLYLMQVMQHLRKFSLALSCG